MSSASLVTEPGFAEVLRTATRPEHEAAEHSGFMAALGDGHLNREAYAALIAQTYFIYQVLEDAGRLQSADPVAGPFVHAELIRVPSLEQDLAFLVGEDWRARIEPLPATTAYCDRLHEVAFTWAGGFVAHHYTRYLGDLSGGQILRRMMERHYRLTDAGLRFYTFDRIQKVKPFRDHYRSLLDDAAWDAAERDRVVLEAKEAFNLNTALFADLGRDLDQWRPAG